MKNPNKSQIRLWCATSLVLTNFILSTSVASAGSTAPIKNARKIEINVPNATGCFKWTDNFTPESYSGAPRPPSFKGKTAVVTPCFERHHFEIYSLVTQSTVSKLAKSKKSTGYYCQQEAKRKSRNSVNKLQELWTFYTVTETLKKQFKCAISGKTYPDPKNEKYRFYTSLFDPEFKVNNQK